MCISRCWQILGGVGAIASVLLAIPAMAVDRVDVHQGADWTAELRQEFYTTDQGSRIMPLAWMRALALPDGQGFLDDALGRYGYLANPENVSQGLSDIPVGFTVADQDGEVSIGMTCAACHTREIQIDGIAYRIDGGPAMVDFQQFLKDLDDAVLAVLDGEAAFDAFAEKVFGGDADSFEKEELRLAVEAWSLRYHTLVERSLPDPAWGPGRLDAVSMILNRLTGLDIGEGEHHLIAENIQKADAPTRYPFLWNAARQDRTQWPGFADNGNNVLGLARNIGEVYGVFAEFRPTRRFGLINRNYIANNSANFEGLRRLEDLIWLIGPPRWPFELKEELVTVGKDIFDRSTESGGCIECHGIRKGEFRSFEHDTWATPVQDVGTDSRECGILGREVDTGVMKGARIPILTDRLQARDKAINVLSASVLGAIVQNALTFDRDLLRRVEQRLRPNIERRDGEDLDYLKGAFRGLNKVLAEADPAPMATAAMQPSNCAYESRVMEGIWAAAPYLHNGSVPSLAALLEPASARPASFKLGPAYDLETVGLAEEQSVFDHELTTTGCDAIDSGNSRCGHEYGTALPEAEKRALLEYLKSL